MQPIKQNHFIILCCTLIVLSCNARTDIKGEEATATTQTPVTVISISREPMVSYTELNAVSNFLQKWPVKANATGYLQVARVKLNEHVNIGEVLYTVKTKEAQSIGNSINVLDSSFKFTGVNSIRANGSGFISQINHQAGDYVQDGDQLALITDTKSFVFLLELPYELRAYIVNKKSLEMILPDGEHLTGMISGVMPTMDPGSQTESIILKVNAGHAIPENLIAKVRLIKAAKENTFSLPKAAVLTDETQTGFWVMKMLDSTTAVKTMIKKGIESMDKVEILSPVFSENDRILISGNYGLSDTARVKVMPAQEAAKE